MVSPAAHLRVSLCCRDSALLQAATNAKDAAKAREQAMEHAERVQQARQAQEQAQEAADRMQVSLGLRKGQIHI